ncbi:hypothetical protein [Mycobacterium hubeiense]|uniref:hypothetical protein n=1 Tax=Mycobacterium hubeiense TaxID=1867256 RepID=UPI000C7F7385|nr:hypothetical protein [Mycobacterium sp. QGD 101]
MTEPGGTGDVVRDVLDAMAPLAAGAQSTPTAEWVTTLHDSGIGRLSVETLFEVVYELAALDGSLGWLAAMFNTAAHDVAGLPDVSLVAASHRVGGELVNRRLTGRWGSVVGAEYADWLLLTVSDGDARRRVLLPRDCVRIDPVRPRIGLEAAGVCDVTVTDLAVGEGWMSETWSADAHLVAAAAAATAVVGSADGVWRKHVGEVRARLVTSFGSGEVTEEKSAQVAATASDIDMAKLQVTTPNRAADAARAYRQAIVRARDAADRLLDSSRHALDGADPVSRQWRDVHAGYSLALQLLDALDPA